MSEQNYSFVATKSILLGDYLDLLLNTAGRRSDHAASEMQGCAPSQGRQREGGKRPETKFMKYEKIIYADQNDPRLGTLPHASDSEQTDSEYEGGILLPHKDDNPEKIDNNDDGSGNIVIIGEPGVGKSTLAFQIAAECTSAFNNGIAVYFSVDVTRSQLIKSMCGNKECVSGDAIACWKRMISLQSKKANDSEESLLTAFKDSLQKRPDDPDKALPQILFPMLSPRGISHNPERTQELFNKRFAELELMLRAVSAYNKEICERLQDKDPNVQARYADAPMVKTVIIDSINMLGEVPLTREQIGRVFELFENYGIIGLFTLGDNTAQTDAEAVNSSTIRYIADVVIHMKREEHNNYTCMAMTVEKSRYVKPLIGAHPYKIVETPQTRIPGNILGIQLKKYVYVMPTLHDIIPGTEKGPDDSAAADGNPVGGADSGHWYANRLEQDNLFGIQSLNIALPDEFNSRKGKSTKTITLAGESGLFKSDLAVNALLSGMMEDEPQTGLIIRMSDRDNFANGGARLEESVIKKLLKKCAGLDGFPSGRKHEISVLMETLDTEARENPVKRTIHGWKLGGVSASIKDAGTAASPCPVTRRFEDGKERKLLEITFKSGALLPEEFISDILMLVIKHKVKRIAFNDIKYIGTSYPFLVDSGTSGTLFISAFIHIMRNYGVDVIMSSSTSEYKPSNDEMKKAVVLSDAVLTFSRDKGSGFHVKVTGEGQMIHNRYLKINVLDEGTECTPDVDSTFIIADRNNQCSEMRSAKLQAFRILEADSAAGGDIISSESILRILERLLLSVQSSASTHSEP